MTVGWILMLSVFAQDGDSPGKAVIDNLKKNRSGDYNTVVQVQEGKSKLLVVKGHFDEVQKVLDGLSFKYDLIEFKDLASKDLSEYLAVFVNCYGEAVPQAGPGAAAAPTKVPDDVRAKIRKYVDDGGNLFSSDWAVALTEAAFPEYIKRKGNSGDANENIPVHAPGFDDRHPLLKDVFNVSKKVRKAEWMIERRSLTFEINPSSLDKVKVLLVSEELNAKYGSQLVAVTFAPKGGSVISTGKGKPKKQPGAVLHVIGHFYQQGLGNKDDDEVARMYQMIVNFVVEAKKAQAPR